MNRFNIVFLCTTDHSRRMQMLVSFSPTKLTHQKPNRDQAPSALHLRKHRHNKIIIYTYIITSTITLAIVSPRAVMHCLNCSTLLGSKEKKQKTTRTSILQSQKWRELQKTWNGKTILPEVYKLTSPNPRNKNKVEIHKDSGLYGIEFTFDKTIPDYNKGSDKVKLDYASAFIKIENVLEGALNLAWKYVLKEHFPEPINVSTGAILPESNRNSMESSSSFSIVRMRRSFEIGS